jgi:muramoyltetrapeptide carboxypeptidase
MERRHFLALTPALAQPASTTLVRPRALQLGDTVGLITPGTYVSDPDRLAAAARTLDHFGLKMRMGRNVRRRDGYLGGSAEERAADLHEMFRDPDVKAILCIRGGVGSSQMLDRIDYDLIRSNPKIWPDTATSPHCTSLFSSALVTFHGLSPFPVSLTTLSSGFAARSTLARWACSNPPETNKLRPRHPLRAVVPELRGLAGGTDLISSDGHALRNRNARPHVPGRRRREPYRIDRMLTQLRLAGKSGGVAGVIWARRRLRLEPSFESTFSGGDRLILGT